MKNLLVKAAAVAGIGLLAACTTGQRGTEVTRFHIEQPIAPQPFNIEPGDPADADSLEFRTYAEIVAAELAQLGFTRAGLDEAEMIAVVEVTHATRAEAARRSPVSIGIGGGSYGGNVGVGLGTSFGVGGSRGGEVMVTQLDVKLKRRSEGTVVWEGRAVRASEPGEASRTAVVQRLADALFEGFPGESGQTITVE